MLGSSHVSVFGDSHHVSIFPANSPPLSSSFLFKTYLRNSIRIVSIVLLRFHSLRQGRMLLSTRPRSSTQGRMTFVVNLTSGGRSGYSGPQVISTL